MFVSQRIRSLYIQVGAGAIATHSTGTATSKFGIGLQDDRRRVIEAYKRNKWLNAVHVHVGSQVLHCFYISLDSMQYGKTHTLGHIYACLLNFLLLHIVSYLYPFLSCIGCWS